MLRQHRHYWQHIPYVGIMLFVMGVVGGIALRATLFLQPLGKHFVDLVWYIGIIAYAIFYFVRISIESHRREICEIGLMGRLEKNSLSKNDIEILHDMLSSHCRSRVKYNYIAWFAISIISLIGAIFFT